MSVLVKLHDLASARHVWLSFKMSAAILKSLSQSSNLVVSHPSNVGLSWEYRLVRFIWCGVMYYCIAVYRGSSIGLEVGHGWRVTASCCSLLVRCASSSMCVGGLAVGCNWASHCCWKHSCSSTKCLWGLGSSLHLAGISPSSSSILWVGCVFSSGVVLWGADVSSVLSYMLFQFSYLVDMLCVLWCFLQLCRRALKEECSGGTSACGSMLMLRMRQRKSPTRQWL